MISIIIPVYNQADHLANCLDAIKNQTYGNYEIIVVNDGSTDGLSEIVARYKKIFGQVLSYLEQENHGAAAARNSGTKLAKGEFLIFCDADVILLPNLLTRMRAALRDNPDASFCYSSFLWGNKLFKLWPFDAERLKHEPYINTTSLIKRGAFPGFDESLKRFQDWDLFLTMAERGLTGVWLDEILFKVNLGGAQTMSHWLPSWSYKLLPFLSAVKKYKRAKEIILKKHNL